ncbi:KTSC domain-containing protein [Candidatus Peregrinibacteria bacterium]|nr:KTSC domain-containing protein [Candidatus Peregrinibacteria bacterium]MBT4148735.1 KTSC domain-containing protein [Candidatus Peregrinibacteria bacterium]MBT4366163.1 KTSC domain-containing protein [Candidatus Peregrinibacteria bacterium]MBT4456266.1 KTSC domain-containing protein [Candidatus Peregrinibacteria bacterium]
MVINLNGTYYHYCGMPSSAWSSFERADSFGTYYNKYIEGDYDCRYNYVPTY